MHERTALLLGEEGLKRLRSARVAVFGMGGVGSYAAEALVRAGVGMLTVVDGDSVAESNLNRQLIALRSTLGRNKAEVFRERAREIDPDADITALPVFYGAENAELVDFAAFDYVADCVDRVTSKLLIVENCRRSGTPVISAMGAGNRLDPAAFSVGDVFRTSGDPLSRVMRKELRKRGIDSLPVVCSTEEPRRPGNGEPHEKLLGSVSFVPGVAGLVLAGKIVRDLAGI